MRKPKLLIVTAREYTERVRTRWFLIATLFGPLLFALIIFLPPWLAMRGRVSPDLARIAILDATGSDLGRRIAAELNGGVAGDTGRTAVRSITPAELPAATRIATREVLERTIRGYLVLDSATLAGRRAQYAGTNATALRDMEAIERIVRRAVLALRLERAGLDPLASASIAALQPAVEARQITIHGRSASVQVSAYFALTMALLFYTSILVYGQAVLRGVVEEKQSRVAEVVLASVSPGELLAGKVLGVGGVGLTQLMVWGGTGLLLAKARAPLLAHFGVPAPAIPFPEVSPGSAMLLLLFFLLGYTFYAALFAAAGATVSHEQDAQQAQVPVTLLLVLSTVFVGPVLAAPDATLARVLGWLPVSAPVIMPLLMSTGTPSPVHVAGSLLLLAAACYVAVRVAARIYRVGLLVYGTRAGVRELVRWVRRSA